MVGQAFRSPSLFESFVDSGAVLQGSKDLDPETSLAYELAYVGAFGNMFVQALGYYAEYDNKVFRETRVQPDGTSAPTYVNGDEFSAVGGEFELRYVAPEIADFFLNYQFVDGDDGDEVPGTDNYNFKYVPENTLALGVAKGFGAVSASVVANFQGEAKGPNETVDDAWTFDLQLAYNQATSGGHKVRHAVVASNVFDEEVGFAEYNRLGAVNDISNGYGRRVLYTVAVAF
jgi:outer membrane receptor protein involved in Fe transport